MTVYDLPSPQDDGPPQAPLRSSSIQSSSVVVLRPVSARSRVTGVPRILRHGNGSGIVGLAPSESQGSLARLGGGSANLHSRRRPGPRTAWSHVPPSAGTGSRKVSTRAAHESPG